jgi:hypothetical protein
VLVLDMIKLLPPLGLNKYDTWRILLVKCYIDNFAHLWSRIRNFRASVAENEDERFCQKCRVELIDSRMKISKGIHQTGLSSDSCLEFERSS